LAKGVSVDAILIDDKALTTLETASNFAAIAHQHQFNSVIAVTQFYHVSRNKIMLKSKGIIQVYSARADYVEWKDGYSILREFLAYYWFLTRC